MSHSAVTGIRAGEAADVPNLVSLVDSELPGFDLQNWQRRLIVPDTYTYLVERESVFGFVTAGKSELLDTGEVLGLWVSPPFRRHGWGRKLLVRSLGFLKRRGFTVAQAFVDEGVVSATLLLRGLDFVELDVTREVSRFGQVAKQKGYQLDLKDYF